MLNKTAPAGRPEKSGRWNGRKLPATGRKTMRVTRWIAPMVAGAALMSVAPQAFAQNFDDPKEFQAAKDLLKMTPQGPESKPWEQNLGGKEVDTAKYKKAGPYRICFSNA